MKRIIILMLVLTAVLYGCGEKAPETSTKSTEPVNVVVTDREVVTKEEKQAESMKDADNDVEPCYLSVCDCNCYVSSRVPFSAKRPICGLDCEKDYGIKGCKFYGDECQPIK